MVFQAKHARNHIETYIRALMMVVAFVGNGQKHLYSAGSCVLHVGVAARCLRIVPTLLGRDKDSPLFLLWRT